jgi:hypothetical protein
LLLFISFDEHTSEDKKSLTLYYFTNMVVYVFCFCNESFF